MSTFNGDKIKIEIFGESHSEKIGANVFGFPSFKLDKNKLTEFLNLRKTKNEAYSSLRIEKDEPVFNFNLDENVPENFSFYILNNGYKSKDYNALYGKPRPSHADYAWFLKDGTLDFTGGGRFSGRLTAPLCVIGSLCKQFLEKFGIKIIAYISEVGKVKGQSYKEKRLSYDEALNKRNVLFPSLTEKDKMLAEISDAKADFDSVGAKVECLIYNTYGGIGDNLFGGIESKISSLIFAVPGVKGIEFGIGFDFCNKRGSSVNDCLTYKNNKVELLTNNSGGINGGITNGEVISLGVAFRPTPSIYKIQKTVDLVEHKNCEIKIEGRHDSCIAVRGIPCIESAVAIALTDEICKKNNE